MQRSFPVDPLKGYGVATKGGRPDDSAALFEVLRLRRVEGLDSLSLRGLLDEPSREIWEHNGVCACGRRTYLFARCPACIEKEAVEELDGALERAHEADEPLAEADGLVVDLLAAATATEKVGGAKFIPAPVLESWGRGARDAPDRATVEVKFGQLTAIRWSPGSAAVDLGKPVPGLPYRTCWVFDSSGVLLQGHQCAKEAGASRKQELEWAVPHVRWDSHRVLVTRVCESMWAQPSVERLPREFLRLVCLLGAVSRVQAWNDGDGVQSVGVRTSLQQHLVLASFQKGPSGHWDAFSLSRKIRVEESRGATPTVVFIGAVDRGTRTVLCLRSADWVLTDWCSGVEGAQARGVLSASGMAE